MIVNLSNTLTPERPSALHQELDLLDRMVEKPYVLSEDLAPARIPDFTGPRRLDRHQCAEVGPFCWCEFKL